MTRWLDRVALAATLLLPVFIMHGRAVAEILIAVVDACFLLRSRAAGDWSWLRAGWMKIGLAFWAWLTLCSVPGLGAGGWLAFGQAASFGRLLLLPAALGHAVLRSAAARRWLHGVLAVATIYIAGQTVLQLVTGRDLQGFPRSGDGELTGPFQHPRAALPFTRLLFPVLLPPVDRLLARGLAMARFAAGAISVASVALVVLMGQRMPLLTLVLGFVVSGLLLRRLRGVVGVSLLAGAALLAASAVVSPPSFYRLVTKFSHQVEDFADTDYGLIAGRAVAIVQAHPVMGQGFDGFRHACADPAYFHPLPWSRVADGGGAAACNIHPHNHYLEAATEAGLPGLALFSALVVAWWAALLRGMGRNPDPLRVGLFASAFIHEWPIASAGGFTAIDLGGFFFVLLGYGLAEAKAAQPTRAGGSAAASRSRSGAGSPGIRLPADTYTARSSP